MAHSRVWLNEHKLQSLCVNFRALCRVFVLHSIASGEDGMQMIPCEIKVWVVAGPDGVLL